MHPLVACIAAIVLVLSACNARAATFTVNSTADGSDGICGALVGGCTLLEAEEQAAATPGRDTIAFDRAVFPPGAPATILLFQVSAVMADPAGTVLDGVGAGVVIEPANNLGPSSDPLVFASTAGAPLTNVTIANITVRNFLGSGIVVCGGEYPSCGDDVSNVVVENVVSTGNGEQGVKITGHVISKAQVINSVAAHNGDGGILCDGSQSVLGTRITGCAVRDNEGAGIDVVATIDNIGTAITDSTAVHNGVFGIGVNSEENTSKTKLTNVTASRNDSDGLTVVSLGIVDTVTIANATSSENMRFGISIGGHEVRKATLKDVVADDNVRGIELDSDQATGVKITNARAVGNQNGGMHLVPQNGLVGAKISKAFVVGNGDFGLLFNGSGNVVQEVRAIGNEGLQGAIELDPPGSGNTIQKCSAHANNTLGTIFVASGNTGNLIQKNVASNNDSVDLTDGNVGCAGNTWKQNVFGLASDACIH